MRSAGQFEGLPKGLACVRRMTQSGMGHRQDQPVEGTRAAPIPPVRLKGALDRQLEFPVPVVGEAQDVDAPGRPVSLQGLPSPLDDLLRGTTGRGLTAQARARQYPQAGESPTRSAHFLQHCS